MRSWILATGIAIACIVVLIAGGAFAAWTDDHVAPTQPTQLCIYRRPAGGFVPVALHFSAQPTAGAAGLGAVPRTWTEQGRMTLAAAAAAYSAVSILGDDGDAERPAGFAQPRSIVDAGPMP